jgi:HlyD family secretion protein
MTRKRPPDDGTVADGAVGGWSVRANVLLGLLTVVALLGTTGAWLAATEISGAVVASGLVVVDSNVKKVQHPTGGVVEEIAVKEGQKVKAGDLLLRLDETVLTANLQLVTRQLDELAVRYARMRAELSGAAELVFPQEILARKSEPHLADIMSTEEELFHSRRSGREGLKKQLEKRIEQLAEEINGLFAERLAGEREFELAKIELGGLEQLEGRNLINTTKITASRRLVAQIEGSVAQVGSRIAQTKGKIAETDLQILQLDQDMKTEVGKELRDLQAKRAELSERRIAAEDQLKRVHLLAPQDGIVHQLAVHTVGGVVAPSEQIMLIVPNADRLVIEVKVAPQDIAQIQVGQHARVRLVAFNQRTTPELDAEVTRVSADLTIENQGRPVSGASGVPLGVAAYFVVRLSLKDSAIEHLEGKHLVPGMPAEVLIKTGDRTALSYIMKPLEDQFARAFRER